MAALQLALRAIGEPQADVVIPVPCWLDYPLYVRSLDMRPIMVPLSAPRFDLDVDAIASCGHGSDLRRAAVTSCQPDRSGLRLR